MFTAKDLMSKLENNKYLESLRHNPEWITLTGMFGLYKQSFRALRKKLSDTSLMPKLLGLVQQFDKEVIGLPIPERPTRLDPCRKDWAHTALEEEVNEFLIASTLADEADALIDLTYFALGRLLEMGLTPGVLFEEVHVSNMLKRRGTLSKRPNSLGFDAIKPKGWTPPDLTKYLNLTREDVTGITGNTPTGLIKALDLKALSEKFDFGSLEMPFKLCIIGHGRHGKDTICERLRDHYGLKFKSSSLFCAEHVMLPFFNNNPDLPDYVNAQACYDDRHSENYRELWYQQICAYNSEDPSRLAREMLVENDVYCGMRSSAELQACINTGLFDYIIWVDASERVPAEGAGSCTVEPWMADFLLDNNGTEAQLDYDLKQLMNFLIK